MVASVSYDVEDEDAPPPTFGLVVLQSEEALEDEFRYFLRDRCVVLHHTRIPSGEAVTLETLGAMEENRLGCNWSFPRRGRVSMSSAMPARRRHP